ncbi:hypothetical protein Ahy_B04g069379 isoform B [Arachis hypogaea]|uniref:Uncharacterized protein n=1 Tax=Arachis hypogaea TaxID=3818 RepID=A0A444ZCF4_ARAHY|nr:hypothetical protein Ahy_B04g069379 isoform A [Arachis hypogaea]RYR11863.1 hypothetical protein Ahy_B04g069379 isoform B [Arachis hypogaea]
MEWWVSMPKVELHAHLNGSIRDSTLLELTKALGEKVDERCDMELDETDPTLMNIYKRTIWHLKISLERLILPFQHEEKLFENIRSKVSKTGESNEGRVLVSILLWNMLSPRIGDYDVCHKQKRK